MRRTLNATGGKYEGGSIAVETAIVLPIMLLFLALPSVLYACYIRQYTAVQKAAHDAAIYLSTAPRLEMTTAGPDGNFAALTLAKKIIAKEVAGIVPNGTPVDPVISCTYRVAATTKVNSCTPQIFKLDTNTLSQFDVALNIPYVNPLTGKEVDAMYMSTVVSTRYLGN
jgi:Flp pilus assembly protein TadG